MTLDELSQLYWLNKEIEADKRRLERVRAMASSPASPDLSGMPHGKGGVHSTTETYAAEITDLETIIAAKQIQCVHERNRLERYIADIPNSETRLIMTLRFVDGLTWAQVAASIGAGHTADRVKKVCYRYIDSVNVVGDALPYGAVFTQPNTDFAGGGTATLLEGESCR